MSRSSRNTFPAHKQCGGISARNSILVFSRLGSTSIEFMLWVPRGYQCHPLHIDADTESRSRLDRYITLSTVRPRSALRPEHARLNHIPFFRSLDAQQHFQPRHAVSVISLVILVKLFVPHQLAFTVGFVVHLLSTSTADVAKVSQLAEPTYT